MCPSPGHDGKPLERFSLSGFPDHLIHHTDLLQLSCFTASATHGMVRDGRNEDLRTLQRPASPFTRRSEVVDEKRLNEIQYPLVVQSVHKAFHDPSIVVPDKKKIQPPAHVVIPPRETPFYLHSQSERNSCSLAYICWAVASSWQSFGNCSALWASLL